VDKNQEKLAVGEEKIFQLHSRFPLLPLITEKSVFKGDDCCVKGRNRLIPKG